MVPFFFLNQRSLPISSHNQSLIDILTYGDPHMDMVPI